MQFALRAELPRVDGVYRDVQRGGALFRPAGRRYRRDARRDQRIPHRPRRKFNRHRALQYQPSKEGPWISFNWRYDSGLVAGAVPCAGGESLARTGPNGTSIVVDVSGLTPDQQFEGGSTAGASMRRRPLRSVRTASARRTMYGSTLISIPAAGTEQRRPQPAPHRIAQSVRRCVGHDNLFHGDKYKWSARLTVINLTNKEALYNFLSTFSGTHYVSPRAITATVGFHF
jgi:hypothetical protein